ncbi:MAG TPA: sialate O-acetylesterase [Cytophagaceae bacterium]|jgi:sialate O-acetylesterase
MKRIILFTLASALLQNIVTGQSLTIPAIFSDNMILQREMRPPIWGKAKPGAEVKIKIGRELLTTRANAKGDWMEYLPEPKLGQEYTLEISSSTDRRVFKNIIVGDVYYAGGQSNMQYAVSEMTGGEEAVKNANYKNIRLFTVPRTVTYTPRYDLAEHHIEHPSHRKWVPCTSENAKGFSAVAYSFAKKIHTDENVPVGIINVTWGGTYIESHTSMEANKSLPYNERGIAEVESKTGKDTVPINYAKETPHQPAVVFNAMINPIIPYGIKGFIWYQGEHNWANPFRYREQFRTFINDLRQRWKQGYLPFYFVQLPGFGKKQTNPMEDFWSTLRESQEQALSLPNTAMAVTLDLGDDDLHPKNKKPMGERLAMIAQKNLYGKSNLIIGGPEYRSYRVNHDTVEITFDNVGSGLVFKNDTAKGFSIAGLDKKFYWADAKIRGNKVLVFSPKVNCPQSVRYGWGENPLFSLFNKEGFPSSPLRTDDWGIRRDGLW